MTGRYGAIERRAVPRIEYGPGERPMLIVGERRHEVLDCSERGLRYRADEASPPAVGSDVVGRVRFPGGADVPIEGAVVRVAEGAVAVQFTGTWLSPEIIAGEVRRLRLLDGTRDAPATDARLARG